MENVIERFLRYVQIDTESQDGVETIPSTKKQFNLANMLKKELEEMGAKNVTIDEHAYVTAEIPSNVDYDTPTIAFISHMDTSPAISGANVKPNYIKNYDGKDIVLNEEKNIVLKTSEYPSLLDYVGQDIITTDGTTLLGADDKAGVAEIMSFAEELINSDVKHGTVKIAFTPDEEVGRGVDLFPIDDFKADFAYTVDGGALGELEYENFNAAGAVITINGTSIHPGSAKNMMKNAILIGMELHSLLPVHQTPDATEGYEGFYHLDVINGGVETTTMEYIIRDHDMKLFNEKKEFMKKAVDFINTKYGEGTAVLDMRDSYYNMKEKVEPCMHLIDNAKLAMEKLGIKPIVTPIRGGTDGARLSFMGLPCPNLCTGGHNYHGKYEYVCANSMKKITELLKEITLIYAQKK